MSTGKRCGERRQRKYCEARSFKLFGREKSSAGRKPTFQWSQLWKGPAVGGKARSGSAFCASETLPATLKSPRSREVQSSKLQE
jgi:hypothetical protein